MRNAIDGAPWNAASGASVELAGARLVLGPGERCAGRSSLSAGLEARAPAAWSPTRPCPQARASSAVWEERPESGAASCEGFP